MDLPENTSVSFVERLKSQEVEGSYFGTRVVLDSDIFTKVKLQRVPGLRFFKTETSE